MGKGWLPDPPGMPEGLAAWLSEVLRARKWYPVNHPGKKGEVGDGGLILNEAGAKGQGECQGRMGAKWRQAHREGRRRVRPIIWGPGVGAVAVSGNHSGDTGGCEIRPRAFVTPAAPPDASETPGSKPGARTLGPRNAPKSQT